MEHVRRTTVDNVKLLVPGAAPLEGSMCVTAFFLIYSTRKQESQDEITVGCGIVWDEAKRFCAGSFPLSFFLWSICKVEWVFSSYLSHHPDIAHHDRPVGVPQSECTGHTAPEGLPPPPVRVLLPRGLPGHDGCPLHTVYTRCPFIHTHTHTIDGGIPAPFVQSLLPLCYI